MALLPPVVLAKYHPQENDTLWRLHEHSLRNGLTILGHMSDFTRRLSTAVTATCRLSPDEKRQEFRFHRLFREFHHLRGIFNTVVCGAPFFFLNKQHNKRRRDYTSTVFFFFEVHIAGKYDSVTASRPFCGNPSRRFRDREHDFGE